MPEENVVPVSVQEHLHALPSGAHSMPVNLYRTENYLVINAGLPRCLAEHVHVSIAAAKLLIKADRHPGEQAIREQRTYVLSELPDGAIGRVLDLPKGAWAYDRAEAHFANGLLTVSIPTQARAQYLQQMR